MRAGALGKTAQEQITAADGRWQGLYLSIPADRKWRCGRDADGTWRRAGDGLAEDRVSRPMTNADRAYCCGLR
jgi:hypothetical protein